MKHFNVFEPRAERNGHFTFGLKDSAIATETLLGGDPMHAESVLTERELTIVQCIAAGKTSLEIAAQLFISPHTVQTHRKNILQRTGAKNCAHLVQLSIVNGWI